MCRVNAAIDPATKKVLRNRSSLSVTPNWDYGITFTDVKDPNLLLGRVVHALETMIYFVAANPFGHGGAPAECCRNQLSCGAEPHQVWHLFHRGAKARLDARLCVWRLGCFDLRPVIKELGVSFVPSEMPQHESGLLPVRAAPPLLPARVEEHAVHMAVEERCSAARSRGGLSTLLHLERYACCDVARLGPWTRWLGRRLRCLRGALWARSLLCRATWCC